MPNICIISTIIHYEYVIMLKSAIILLTLQGLTPPGSQLLLPMQGGHCANYPPGTTMEFDNKAQKAADKYQVSKCQELTPKKTSESSDKQDLQKKFQRAIRIR